MTATILTHAAAGRELEYAEVDGNFAALKAGIDFLLPADAAFSTAIPFTGNVYMPQQTVASVLAFTVAAAPVRGARVYIRLSADGTNAPTFTGFKEWGGSAGYDNRAGIVNELEFYYDGVDYWYFINQAIDAVAGADTTEPTANSAAVANSTPLVVSIAMSESLDSGYVPASSAFAVGGHTVSSVAISGASINLTCSAAFVNGEAARTVAYTQPGTNNARDASGNLLASFSGLSITNNVGAVLTVPGQVTGLTIGTATSTTQPLTWSDAASDGGSSKTDFTIQWSPAGANTWTSFSHAASTANAITVTGLTADTPYDYRVAQVNSIGTGVFSATVTGSTADAVQFGRAGTSRGTAVESGDGTIGWQYTSQATTATFADSFILQNTPKLPVGAWASVKYSSITYDLGLFGFSTSATPGAHAAISLNGIWSDGSTWRHLTNGNTSAAANAITAGQVGRIRRVSATSVVAEASSDNGVTWPVTLKTWTVGSSDVLYMHFYPHDINPGARLGPIKQSEMSA